MVACESRSSHEDQTLAAKFPTDAAHILAAHYAFNVAVSAVIANGHGTLRCNLHFRHI